MIRKSNKMVWKVLWLGTLVSFIGVLFVLPCLAQTIPKGEAVIAVDEPFMMTGGDPHTARGAGYLNFGYAIFDGLVRKNADNKVVPALAKSWKFAQDGKSLNFTLDERAKFHNGDPVTAEDVKFSFERAMKPELKYSRAAELNSKLDRIEIIDDHHINFYFKSPFKAFFEWQGPLTAIVPKAYIEKVGDAEFAKHPIGAGPYKLVKFQQDVFADLEAVDDHYRKIPSVKKLHFKIVMEPATLMAMLKAGEADIIRVPTSNVSEVKNDPSLRIIWSKFYFGFSLLFCDLAFPDEPSPFKDIRVRKAASYAINRKAICEKILNGTAEPWGDILSPNHLGYDPSVKPDPYDPEKAKALLKEAGYPDGFDTTFTCGFLGDKIEAQAIVSDLAKVGIRAKIDELEFGTFVRNFHEKKFRGLARFLVTFWLGQIQPAESFQAFCVPQNPWCYYVTPEIIDAFEKLSNLVDDNDIAAQAREVSRIYRNEGLRYTLWAAHKPFGLSPKVKSYLPVQGWMWTANIESLELND